MVVVAADVPWEISGDCAVRVRFSRAVPRAVRAAPPSSAALTPPRLRVLPVFGARKPA